MTVKVKDVLLCAAQMLGVEEEARKYINGEGSAEGEKDVALLLSCFQRVENELALDYLPLIAEDEVMTATGAVEFSALSRSAVRILCVEDEWGQSLKYKLLPTHLQTQAGKVKITYAYAPATKGLEDNSDYALFASERLLAYGVAGEYSLVVGDMSAVAAWDKKYKDAVQAAYTIMPCKKIRSRRWV